MLTSQVEAKEGSYFEYLDDARLHIKRCAHACQAWSAPYDGENPAPDSVLVQNQTQDDAPAQNQEPGNVPVQNHVQAGAPVHDTTANNVSPDPSCDDSDIQRVDVNESNKMKTAVARKPLVDIVEDEPADHKTPNDPVDSSVTSCQQADNDKFVASDNATNDKSRNKQNAVTDSNSDTSQIESNTGASAQDNQSVTADTGAARPQSLPAFNSSHSPQVGPSSTPVTSESSDDVADLNTFIQSLRRVSTPVDLSESLEECLNEIDELVSECKSLEQQAHKQLPAAAVKSQQLSQLIGPNSDTYQSQLSSPDSSLMTSSFSMKKSISMDTVSGSYGLGMSKSVSLDTMGGAMTPGRPPSVVFGAPMFTPTRYSMGSPDIGEFMVEL